MIQYERFGFLCPKCNEWQYQYKESEIYSTMKTGDMYCSTCQKWYRSVVVHDNEITYDGHYKYSNE